MSAGLNAMWAEGATMPERSGIAGTLTRRWIATYACVYVYRKCCLLVWAR